MKGPSILGLLAAMLANGTPAATPPYKEDFVPSRVRRGKTSSPSQRQMRKNRRRAHAAGSKKAFL